MELEEFEEEFDITLEFDKWYVMVDDADCKWIFQYKGEHCGQILSGPTLCYGYEDEIGLETYPLCWIEEVKSIRLATNREIKQFDDFVKMNDDLNE